MTGVVFCSGFAGPEALFPGLSGRWQFVAPFLDGDEAALLARVRASRARVLAGWSTGAHMLLKHAPELFPRFERVVLIAPFLRFADCFPARLTRAMAAGMAGNAAATVRGFWQNCGIDSPPAWNPAWAAPLADGLAYLLVSEAAPGPVAAGHVTVCSGAADRIVRPAAVDKVLAALPGAGRVEHAGGHFPAVSFLEDVFWP
ncbi:alpha/beta fold hydrolase [Solidesulfovibrio sp.]